MEARAELRQVRISPRKVGIVLDLIRNKPVDVALATLNYTPKAACEILEKLFQAKMCRASMSSNIGKVSYFYKNRTIYFEKNLSFFKKKKRDRLINLSL